MTQPKKEKSIAGDPTEPIDPKDIDTDLPEGFKEEYLGGSGVEVDWDKTPVVQGKLLGMKRIKVKGKETRLMEIKPETGESVMVWEKSKLGAFFDRVESGEVKAGCEVYIIHTGKIEMSDGRDDMYDFRVATK